MGASSSFVKKYIAEFVFIFFIFLSGIMLAFNSGGFVLNFKEVGFTVLASFQKGVNTVYSEIGKTFNAIQELSKLREENKMLEEKLQNYEYLQRNNTEIRKENERLKEQLEFSNKIEQKNYPAQIIGRNADNLYSFFTINKGSRNGIKRNMPVIAVQRGVVGVVGKITAVGATTSIVMPVYDVKCNISARIQNSREVGLVNGTGTSDNRLSLSYIKKRSLEDLKIGDMVVTSGENENYIRDIPIGTISKIKVLDYDSSLEIELVPIVDFSRLETVIVTDVREINVRGYKNEEQ